MSNFISAFLGSSIGAFIVSYLFMLEMDKRYIKKGDVHNEESKFK